MKRTLALLASALASAAPAAEDRTGPDPHGRIYETAPPMDETITRRVLPQIGSLLDKLLRERRAMTLDGVPVFEVHDKFLPGKIAVGLSYLLLESPRTDPRFRGYLDGYRTIAAMTIDDPNESWGIYYYMSALYQLKRAGLLEQAVGPETLAKLRIRLDWRRFVRPDGTLIDLPNNYYGVAFSVSRLRNLLGWEDASASEALLARMIDHYRRYSGGYGFADETDGHGRFDRYSVLLIGEIAQRFIETGTEPPRQVKEWLRGSAQLLLQRANLTGEGFEYGRSIGAYGDTAPLEVLAAAAKLQVLTPRERDMAYALSSRITARYADFWLDENTGSVNLWDGGRRTDAYRGKNRILGENLSLARQHIYTNAEWNEMGYRGRAPADVAYARWLGTLPPATLTWFSRGSYDRALLTVRDGSHVIGLPLINGAESQHNHNPYFPIPFSPGMLQGSADATFPQLTPRFTLAGGDVLMPLAWFKEVAMRREGRRTFLTFRLDAMDRMGGRDAVEDGRLRVETRYDFVPGRITRTDRYMAAVPLDLAGITLEFATFSSSPEPASKGVTFKNGEVTSFVPVGLTCSTGPASAEEYRSPVAPFKTVVSCASPARRITPGAPITLGWTLTYR
jgi:hypothetical protein